MNKNNGTPDSNKPTVLDLFCGAGGFSEGFKQAGFSILGGVDNSQSALLTYRRNFPDSVSSIIDLAGEADGLCCQVANIYGRSIDVMVGGPPCQGISLSGLRIAHDPRNKLLLAFVNLVKNLRPRAFVLENVPGLAGLFNSSYKNAILEEFSKTDYSVAVSVLIAADYGVPQIRKRIFFVGLRRHDREFVFPHPDHHPPESIFTRGNGKKYVTCGDAFGDLPPLADELGDGFQEYSVSPQNEYQNLIREGSEGIYNHIAACHGEKVKGIIRLVPPGGNYKDLPENLRDTRKFHVAWTRFSGDEPAPTIDTGHRHHFHYKYDRVPTVREHARLQSFPDRFIFEGTKTQQFSQVGNAVPPLLAKAIAFKIKEQL